MRLLFVVDARSPIAINWIRYFIENGYETHVISSYSCEPELSVASFNHVPVAFSNLARRESSAYRKSSKNQSVLKVKIKTNLRQWLGPLTVRGATERIRSITDQIQPDLMHAMRIPYEGMAAALGDSQVPSLISVWGNDFTLHAQSNPLIKSATRKTLGRVDALHADCCRDIRLAYEFGFSKDKPTLVVPGGGGVQLDLFFPSEMETNEKIYVINPRGYRAYVDNNAFIKAAKIVCDKHPDIDFLLPAMDGINEVENWIQDLQLEKRVTLLPKQSRLNMAGLFKKSDIFVSPSLHDGTPNTLLEALACGCFPIAGDIESIREWIVDGINGFLVDPTDQNQIAEAILKAVDDKGILKSAQEKNLQIIQERADYKKMMPRVEAFYKKLVEMS